MGGVCLCVFEMGDEGLTDTEMSVLCMPIWEPYLSVQPDQAREAMYIDFGEDPEEDEDFFREYEPNEEPDVL